MTQRDDARVQAAIAIVESAGYVVVDPGRSDELQTRVPAERRTADALTVRERAVLALLAEGFSNKRIAARLAVSEHTAKFHVGSVLAKLGAATRAEAVALGVRRGDVIL